MNYFFVGEQVIWSVQRQLNEFYNLETALTEYHGELDTGALGDPLAAAALRLPPRPPRFGGAGLDVLQERRPTLEAYLRALVARPALKSSEVLVTFLTAPEEFHAGQGGGGGSVFGSQLSFAGVTGASMSGAVGVASAAPAGLGRVMGLPMKLGKERAALAPFMQSFVAQMLPGQPRPRSVLILCYL
jgi:hypothetical protein